jgi:hypothetical protein
MNLNDLNSTLPKPWLNLQCNSLVTNVLTIDTLTAQTINVDTIKAVKYLGQGPAEIMSSPPSTINLTPAQVINGTLAVHNNNSFTVVLPSDVDLNAALNPTVGLTFDFFLVYNGDSNNSGLGVSHNVTINCSGNVKFYTGQTVGQILTGVYTVFGPVLNTLNMGQKLIRFVFTSAGWIVYL